MSSVLKVRIYSPYFKLVLLLSLSVYVVELLDTSKTGVDDSMLFSVEIPVFKVIHFVFCGSLR